MDLDNLIVSQPESGEDALNIAETLIRSGAIEVIVVDSVAALVSKAELNGQMGDTNVGLQARMMSQAMRRLTAVINKSKCIADLVIGNLALKMCNIQCSEGNYKEYNKREKFSNIIGACT